MADPGIDSHWVQWHRPYEDPESSLSVRLRLVQAALGAALDEAPPGPIRLVSLCAGQGRDVIDVVGGGHRRAGDVEALLVELDPDLVAFARDRAATAGVSDRVRIVEGDAARCAWYADMVPAQVVLACGIFGNISDDDIEATIGALSGFCSPGAHVLWTRHRKPPDFTPAIRHWFVEAGFEEVAFHRPDGPYVMSVGDYRYVGGGITPAVAFDPERVLFTFTGDGFAPA